MARLIGVLGCFTVAVAAGVYRLIVVERIRTELGLQASASLSGKIKEEWNFMELLRQHREHKARFPLSRARSLSKVLIGAQLLFLLATVALIIDARFQPHSMIHLISRGR
jgi:hypothetical protein